MADYKNDFGSPERLFDTIHGKNFTGKAATAGTADTATKANQDKNGNDIPSTYATKNELAGYSLVNGVPSFTYTV